MKFNANLTVLRKDHEWTQKELAKKLGVSESTVRMYEAGERKPDIERLEQIADLFHVDMNFLLGHSDYVVRLSGDETDPDKGIEVMITPEENDLLYAWRHADESARRIAAYALKLGQSK